MIKLKKIKINNYDFSFLLKPLMILSTISAVLYMFKIYNAKYTNEIFIYIALITLLVPVLNNCKNIYKKLTAVFILVIISTLYISIYDDLVIYFAEKSSSSGLIFGILNILFDTFGLNDLEDLIYHTSYGGTKFINGNLITGAIDIFLEERRIDTTHTFLSTKLLLLFIMPGITLSFSKNKKEALFITLLAIITGNFTIYLLMLLFVFTPYYFIFLLFNFLCCFISIMAEINCGFSVNPSFFELIFYNDNLLYVFVLGIFLCAVSYYFSRLVKEKLKW